MAGDAESQRSDPPATGPREVLPEVTPPSAGFILQLFVIPLTIVTAIILVWLLFAWLAQMGGSPRDYVEGIEQNKANSWQLAYNLSTELATDPAHRNDLALSNQLAAMLERRIDQPLPTGTDDRKNEVMLRVFLAKALGEFEVAEASLPVLLAASTAGGEETRQVRQAALEALALLASNIGPIKLQSKSTALLPMLLDASRHGEQPIAERAVFALGILGGEKAIARLEEIVSGAGPASVRYNAATGLARHGNPAAVPVLVEMLDPAAFDDPRLATNSIKGGIARSAIRAAKDDSYPLVDPAMFGEGRPTGLSQQEDANRHAVIVLNALRATRQLIKQNPQADLSELRQAVDAVLARDLPAQLAAEAADVRDLLAARSDSA